MDIVSSGMSENVDELDGNILLSSAFVIHLFTSTRLFIIVILILKYIDDL